MPKSALIPVTDELWDDRHKHDHFSGYTLMVFQASWCEPCEKLIEVLEKAAKTHPDVKILSYDVDKHNKAVRELVVKGIPTLVLLHNGSTISNLIGHQSVLSVERFLKAHRQPQVSVAAAE